jgi:hypothetical protein
VCSGKSTRIREGRPEEKLLKNITKTVPEADVALYVHTVYNNLSLSSAVGTCMTTRKHVSKFLRKTDGVFLTK